MPRVALELAVREGALLERPRASRPARSTGRGRAARAGRRRRRADGGADERDEQLGVDPRRQRGRPRGRAALSPGLSSRRLAAGAARSGAAPSASDTPQGLSGADAPDEVRDQPASVDPRDVAVGGRDRRHLARVRVDVVALEVERAPVAVDRDADLVGGRLGDPVVLRLERRRFVSQNVPDLLLPDRGRPGPTVKVAFGAHRLIIRSMSFFVVAWWKFFSIWPIA